MGMVLTAGVALLLAGLWVSVKFLDQRRKSEEIVETHITNRFVETGEVSAMTCSETTPFTALAVYNGAHRKRLAVDIDSSIWHWVSRERLQVVVCSANGDAFLQSETTHSVPPPHRNYLSVRLTHGRRNAIPPSRP